MAGIEIMTTVQGRDDLKVNVELETKRLDQEVYVGEHLSCGSRSEGASGIAVAANRTREIRLSGMRGGLAETWANG